MQMSWKRDSADIGCERTPSSMYLGRCPRRGKRTKKFSAEKEKLLGGTKSVEEMHIVHPESLNALRTLMPQWQKQRIP